MKDSITIASLRIRNVMSIESLEVSPGQVTVVKGKNEKGKTSLLEAVRFILKGGQDSTLLKHGEDGGEGEMVLTNGVKINRRISSTGVKTSVTDEDGARITAPQTFLDSLYDYIGTDPLALITAKPEDRVKTIMEAMPITVERDRLLEAVGDLVELPEGVERGHALNALDSVAGIVYNERTIVNRNVKNMSGTIESLRKVVSGSTESSDDLESRIGDIQVEIGALKNAASKRIEKIRLEKEKIEAEIIRLQEAKRECDSRVLSVNTNKDSSVMQLESQAEVIEEKMESAKQVKMTKDLIDKNDSELWSERKKAEDLTQCLSRVKAIKTELVSELPIDIVFGEDGEIYDKDGTPFHRINDAKKVIIALEVAALRARKNKLGLICVDRLEMLDSESFAEVVKWVRSQKDIQLIGARVTDDTDLVIETN